MTSNIGNETLAAADAPVLIIGAGELWHQLPDRLPCPRNC